MNSIKNVLPTKSSRFKQGYFTPKNPQKYIGKLPIIYRSSWERKCCVEFDVNTTILKWASEPFPVSYFSILDNKFHNYYPDFYIMMQTKTGIVEYVVEVKPKSQLMKPVPPKRNTKKLLESYKYAYEHYVRNLCKIDALRKFALERKFEVMLITEDSKLFA